RIGTDGEADAVRSARRRRDHAPSGRCDFDGDLCDAHLVEPFEPTLEPVALDGIASEVGLHGLEIALEAGDRILRLPDALYRRVTAADTEHRPSTALDLK